MITIDKLREFFIQQAGSGLKGVIDTRGSDTEVIFDGVIDLVELQKVLAECVARQSNHISELITGVEQTRYDLKVLLAAQDLDNQMAHAINLIMRRLYLLPRKADGYHRRGLVDGTPPVVVGEGRPAIVCMSETEAKRLKQERDDFKLELERQRQDLKELLHYHSLNPQTRYAITTTFERLNALKGGA